MDNGRCAIGRPLGYWVRGNEKTERWCRSVWGWYVCMLLFDFCTHDVVCLAIAEDEELTVAEEFVGVRLLR